MASVKKYLNIFHDNNDLWITLQNGNLGSLLDRAKDLEEKYEWLQAAKDYEKASELSLEAKDLLKAAELQQRVGFCYYRAAMQSKDNTEFKSVLRRSILAYEKEAKLLESAKREEYQAKIDHANAMDAYIRSWYETDPDKVKALLEEWWTLENQVLEAYESIGNIHSVGVVCTDLIEFSQYTRLWLSTHSEEVKMEKEAQNLAEKAIQALLKSGNNYELARAYCFASLWFCSQSHLEPNRGKRAQIIEKGYDYSQRALALSSETGNAWLIGYAHDSAHTAAMWYDSNHKLAVDHGEETQRYGNIAKDKLLLSKGTWFTAQAINFLAMFLEDPDKQRTNLEKAWKLAQECIRLSKIIRDMTSACWGYYSGIGALNILASIETDPKNKQRMLQKAIEIAREGLEILRGWKRLPGILYDPFSESLRLLSETKNEVEEKKTLLLEAQSYQRKNIAEYEEYAPFLYSMHSIIYHHLGSVQIGLANIETDKTKKVELLEEAVVSLEKSDELFAKDAEWHPEPVFIAQVWGKHGDRLGRVRHQIYCLTNEEKTLSRAIEAHRDAAAAFTKGELPAHAAESYWYIAQLEGQVGEHKKAYKSYESASQAYDVASKKIPQLKEFYKDYSRYMQAWSQLEQARFNHSVEEYEKARQNYQKTAKLHESTEQWGYLAPNYLAWASMEEAESLSRNENTQQAKNAFQKALGQFAKAEKTIKDKTGGEMTSAEEKGMTQKLLQASNLRREYCQARILVENAKLLDRKGKYLQSSKSYSEAADKISRIIDMVDVEAERKELEYLATLFRAWEKMAVAEEQTSSESYLEAAELFENAKAYCFTRKASLWALGNSSFCRGLAAGVNYQTRLDVEEHIKAKGCIKNAATNY